MGTDASRGDGLCAIDETSLDMLKNTPSNIRRLNDEIDQHEGRRKYLAQTESPSDGGDVRWYFCKVPLGVNQLAPSVPRTEIVGKGEYFRFGMRDSLAIEAAFLQREEELLSHWWKEYAECSIGPTERTNLSSTVDLQPSTPTSELFAVEEERVGVPVKGGLYEVDLVRRHSFPVYWNGEHRRVLRGHWFAQSGGLDWLPLREDVAEQLEFAYRRQVWHRRTFQPSGLFAARVDMQGSTPGLHALFTGEDATWEAWLNVDASGFSTVINFGGNGIKLRRGYAASQSPKPTQDELRQQREEEMDDYCSEVPVRHLVFMVHGIGQRLEKSNLVDDVTNFRLITSSLAEKHLTSHQRETQRVLYIPCQWRKGLKLSSESAVEKITLDGVRGLRTALSATVHDVLYYMSPIHCQDIIDSVSNQLNRLYVKFLKRNPGYEGKVSIYGHSLGSVLSYDILCHQEILSAPFPMDCMYREQGKENQSSAHAIKEQKMRENESLGNISNLSTRLNVKFDGAKGTLYTDDENNVAPLDLEKEPCKDSLPVAGEQSSTKGMKEEISRSNFSSSLDCHEPASNCFDTFTAVKEILDEGANYNHQNMVAQSDTTRLNIEETIDETSGETSAGNKEIMASKEKVALSDTNRAHVAESASLTEHITDETSGETSVTNKEIMALREKIELLSARVMDLESQVCVKKTIASDRRYASQNDATRSLSEQDEPKRYKPIIKYTKLKFQVDTFFAVGSPLGVFLALRNVRLGIGKGKDYWEEENIIEEMPGCRRMFNIFHPFDPVAYRIEPLVCKEYTIKRPVIIPYHRGGKRLHVGFQDFVEDVAAHSQAFMDRLNSVREKVLTICQSKDEGLEEEEVREEERSYGSIMIEQLTGSEEGRIDHSLQDKTFRHPYISALGAHTNYWRDRDTALFMLKHLYEDIPQQFQQSNPSHQDNILTGNEFTDEELPLTFSESSLLIKSAHKSRRGKRESS